MGMMMIQMTKIVMQTTFLSGHFQLCSPITFLPVLVLMEWIIATVTMTTYPNMKVQTWIMVSTLKSPDELCVVVCVRVFLVCYYEYCIPHSELPNLSYCNLSLSAVPATKRKTPRTACPLSRVEGRCKLCC